MSYQIEFIIIIGLVKLFVVGPYLLYIRRNYVKRNKSEATVSTLVAGDEAEASVKAEVPASLEMDRFEAEEYARLQQVSLNVLENSRLGQWNTLSELIKRVEELRRVAIETVDGLPVGLPVHVTSLCFRSSVGQYTVYYDPVAARFGAARNFALLHQLAHILRGEADLLPAIKTEDVLTAIQAGKSLDRLPGVYYRGHYQPEPQKVQENEFIGRELGARISWLNQKKTEERYIDRVRFFSAVFMLAVLLIGLVLYLITTDIFVMIFCALLMGLVVLFQWVVSFSSARQSTTNQSRHSVYTERKSEKS